MIGSRWARCWTMRPETPYWEGEQDAWLPDRAEPKAADPTESGTEPKQRLSQRFRLTPRRRIKRSR